MTHMHADVTENSYFISGRSECFTGESALDQAQEWLASEIESDDRDYPNPKEGNFHTIAVKCRQWTGSGEAWEGEVTIPNASKPGHGVIMGYRLMWIDGACERSM